MKEYFWGKFLNGVKRRRRCRFRDQGLYEKEIADTGLIAHLKREIADYHKLYQGKSVGRGQGADVGADLPAMLPYFHLLRSTRPQVVVETGVCNGVSTALILQALEINNAGVLYSIDYPEYIEGQRDEYIWSGKGGAAIPQGKAPGSFIPEPLKKRWHLILGKTTDELRPLLESLKPIDLFIHDSEHSYECMMFEYVIAWRHLSKKGVLASNDISWNHAFFHFALLNRRLPFFLGDNDAFIVK